ncbi:Hsp70 nucleotide exchange factor FES1 [Erysiphe neolycopersici]|uniref:Hsp70 nucleotide exchange factor FES1 n=1 Tax=Erysiphe neolycopersici TaxID=212602 RepID=A0A420I0L7_9PEZI|nr:Hsp70 nucleotide exchange factor FES1 [Erysiphe neolycopersici]
MNPGLNELLKWSVANSTNPPDASAISNQGLNPSSLNALFGGPTDTQLMITSMEAIRSRSPSVKLEDKLVAFDNFEQLVENIDNANNLEPAQLWSPLLDCLDHEEGEIRKMAAWCIGTAVQNNQKSQEMLLVKAGLPKLVKLATADGEAAQVRKKAVYALSSACRNYQPAMNVLICELRNLGKETEDIDASDMEACDELMGVLREAATS